MKSTIFSGKTLSVKTRAATIIYVVEQTFHKDCKVKCVFNNDAERANH
jgi:hypothetical protein